MKGRPKTDWSNWRCIKCGSSEKHTHAKLCKKCWNKKRSLANMERYRNDPEYREKKRALGRKSGKKRYRKMMKETPKLNAQKQKEFRNKHPDSFNLLMCRCYMRKLSDKKLNELLKEREQLKERKDNNIEDIVKEYEMNKLEEVEKNG